VPADAILGSGATQVNSNEVLRRFREQGLAVPTGTGPSGKDAEVQQALGASTLTRTETEKRCVRSIPSDL